jgi:hypothetical protein
MAAGVSNQMSGFAELASLLWRERESRERVLFKIVEEQLVSAAGRTRWLTIASAEIEAAMADLRRGEAERADEAGALAGQLGLPAGIELIELAEAAPEPWNEILRGHCEALRELASEIEAATNESRRILDAAVDVGKARRGFARLRGSIFAPVPREASG